MADNDPCKDPARKTLGFRFGLVESFILIFILFTGFELYVDYTERVTTAHNNAEKLFAQASNSVQSELRHIYDDVKQVLHSVRTFRGSNMFDPVNTRSANNLFVNYMKQYPFVTSINIGDSAGNGYLILRMGDQLRNRITRPDEKGWVAWFILGAGGEIVSTERLRDNYDPRTSPWYRNSISREEIFWSDPYIFRTTRDVGVTASMRIDNRTDKEVIGADIKLEDLSHLLAALTGHMKGMTAHLITDDGAVVASSEDKQFLSHLQQANGMLPRIGKDRYPVVEKALQSRTGDKIWLFRFDNKRFLAAMEPVSFFPNGKYRLVLTVPEEVLSGTFEKDAIWKLIVEFLLLTAACSWYFVRYIVPLRRILTGMKEFGTGKFSILPVDAARNDEVGDLASEFIQMTGAFAVKDESLKEQKKFTENLIESSAAAIFVLDPQHKVILWNRACEELTGIAASAMVGTGNHWQAFYDHERPCLSDIVLDIGHDKHKELYDVAEKSTLVPNGLHAEGWYHNLNGRERYIIFDAAPVYDERGILLAAIETLNEITENKRAESNMRLQSAALQAAANSIVITDNSGTIEWVNPAFTMLTGYSAEEAIGRNPRELVKSGVHDQAFFKKLWDTILKGEVWRGQIMNRHKDGTLYPEGQTITPVKEADGEITHFIAIKRDLTEQRKLEEQLQHAQRMESVGTLAGGIAHDFNNILSAIIGYGQFSLLKMPGDDPLRHNIESMLEAADRAARLTRELLLFSRKQPTDKKPVDLNLVVAKVEKFLRKVIGEDIMYNTVIHEAPLPVLADEHQLEQVLMNLATNARDSMPKGGTLTVATENILLGSEFVSANSYRVPGPYALITVSDTGEGMDEATRQRIFEPFFTTKEVGKGTGLGLAVTYGIIKQHDGYINVYSEPGGGTTFRIYLPLIPQPDAGEEPPALQEETPIGGTETILLAEDDEDVRVLTKRLLTEFGYTVIEAVDGADAVNKFTENSADIDLILSDLIMPKMNGKEVVYEIRKIRPDIKVIFSSGYAPDTIRQKVALTDSGHLIAKPVSPRELLRKVRSVLDGGTP